MVVALAEGPSAIVWRAYVSDDELPILTLCVGDAGFDAAILVYGDAAQIRFVGRMRSVSRPSQWVHADIVRLPEDLTGTLTGAGSHRVPRDLAARLGCVLACWQAVTGVYGKTDGVCRDQSIF